MFNEFGKKNADCLYGIFRILVGLLFFTHGAMKLFGWFGGNKVASIASLFGLAGLIEVVVGALLVFGLWSRLMAGIGAIQMFVAFTYIHVGLFNAGKETMVLWPWANGGELALMYFAAFLVVLGTGNGVWSLEKMMKK